MNKISFRYLEPYIEDVLKAYDIEPYEPAIKTATRHRSMLPQDILKSITAEDISLRFAGDVLLTQLQKGATDMVLTTDNNVRVKISFEVEEGL
jgi:hypothetical protein